MGTANLLHLLQANCRKRDGEDSLVMWVKHLPLALQQRHLSASPHQAGPLYAMRLNGITSVLELKLAVHNSLFQLDSTVHPHTKDVELRWLGRCKYAFQHSQLLVQFPINKTTIRNLITKLNPAQPLRGWRTYGRWQWALPIGWMEIRTASL